MSQLSLFDYKQASVEDVKNHPLFSTVRPHIVENFWEYHKQNPHVFELFVRFTRELQRAGRAHYGIGAITERIRWHLGVETQGEDFKMANNHRSCYARLLMATFPEFENFFETRRSPGTVPLSEDSISGRKRGNNEGMQGLWGRD